MRLSGTILAILLSAAVVGGARPVPPARSTPEAQGISSAAVLRFVEETEQKLDATGTSSTPVLNRS